MTTPTALFATPSGPARTAAVGPMLWLLRLAFAAQAALAIAQPVLAGQYLAGDFDALTGHAINAGLMYLGSIAAFVAALLYWLVGRGAGWPTLVVAGLFVAINAQTAFGALRILTLHIPLGVAIVATAAALAVWSFRPSARQQRAPRVRAQSPGVAR